MSYPEPLAPKNGAAKKRASCLGFLLWCVALFVGFVVIVVGGILFLLHHGGDQSSFSARVNVDVVQKPAGYQGSSRHNDHLVYTYEYGGHLYQYDGYVDWLYDSRLWACVDPKNPKHHILSSDIRNATCGDKSIGRERTATVEP